MSIKNIESLNSMQMDVLKEIGNIGSGNAATSLSTMLGSPIDLAVPTVKALDYNETVNLLGGPENIVIGLLIRLSGDISGMMMYLLQTPFANAVVGGLYGKKLSDLSSDIDDMDRSAICEIGNIMAGSYMNAISALTGLNINISVPDFCVDMAGAIMSVPVVEFAQISDKVLFIDDHFTIRNDEIRSNMILIPELDSLETLFRGLGIEI